MSAAPNAAWIWLALPWYAAHGIALALCIANSRTARNRPGSAQLLALSLCAGLLLNYALGLVIPDLRLLAAAGALVVAANLAWVANQPRGQVGFGGLLAIGWTPAFLIATAMLLFGGVIVYEPLQAWDARSIWFFQAKRIYFDGGLRLPGEWGNPAYFFSHIDYPKLLPILGASIAQAFGLWNEYIPKGALLILLAAAVLGLAGLARAGGGLSALFLASVLLLAGKDLVWNGYMDAFAGLYAGLAVLYAARWLQHRGAHDLVSGILFLALTAALKNEGMLFGLCTAAVVGAGLLLPSRTAATPPQALPRCAAVAVFIALAGFGAWSVLKVYWHMHNDLALGPASLVRIGERLAGGASTQVLKALVVDGNVGHASLVLFAAAVAAKALRTPLPLHLWVPAAAGLGYFAGLALVYLATPSDLGWHLRTSADRTTLMAVAGLFGSAFLILEAIETWPGTATGAPAQPAGLNT